ncbi:MAG TPA: hypothetical protein DIC60_01090 [Lachnospiraceae bacterium]|nr:hypothetical protein [Lachnospiraceae bacterium]
MKIIDRLLEIMDELQVKPSDLANFLGINKSVISNWKTRSTNPPSDLIVPICEFLKIDISYLLTGTQTETNKNIIMPNLSLDETSIIDMYRELDKRDKEDIYDCLTLKYNRSLKRGKTTSYNSPYTDKNDTKKSDPDDHNSSSGIA